MVMLKSRRNYLKILLLTVCYILIFFQCYAQEKPKIQQQDLYDNLIDEKCVARPRVDMLPPPGLPVDKMIYCNDQLVASVSAENCERMYVRLYTHMRENMYVHTYVHNMYVCPLRT